MDAAMMRRLAEEKGQEAILYIRAGWEESAWGAAYNAAQFARTYLELSGEWPVMQRPARRKQPPKPSQVRARKKALGKGLLQAASTVKKHEGVVPDWLRDRMKEK